MVQQLPWYHRRPQNISKTRRKPRFLIPKQSGEDLEEGRTRDSISKKTGCGCEVGRNVQQKGWQFGWANRKLFVASNSHVRLRTATRSTTTYRELEKERASTHRAAFRNLFLPPRIPFVRLRLRLRRVAQSVFIWNRGVGCGWSLEIGDLVFFWVCASLSIGVDRPAEQRSSN